MARPSGCKAAPQLLPLPPRTLILGKALHADKAPAYMSFPGLPDSQLHNLLANLPVHLGLVCIGLSLRNSGNSASEPDPRSSSPPPPHLQLRACLTLRAAIFAARRPAFTSRTATLEEITARCCMQRCGRAWIDDSSRPLVDERRAGERSIIVSEKGFEERRCLRIPTPHGSSHPRPLPWPVNFFHRVPCQEGRRNNSGPAPNRAP